MEKTVGKQSIRFEEAIHLISAASIAGKKEGEGPLGKLFDKISADPCFGMETWEKAESAMQKLALQNALDKAKQAASTLDFIFAGDLLNQCIASSFAIRGQGVPFFGLYGACSTMAESLTLASMMLDGGFGEWAAAMASSHFCSAERQYRTPLEYGGQRTPTAQWTATAAGACLLRPAGQGGGLRAVTFGRVQDLGIRDINNMGAAMAPAAAATLLRYLTDTNTQPQEFDAICTGDLGHVGSQLFRELLAAEGLLLKNHVDCGSLLYDAEGQSVHSGASGPGCCAAVLCGHLLPRLERRGQRRVLFLATGALMSQTTFLQKESIPAISHLVELAAPEEQNGGNT